MIENVHAETYANLLETYVKDPKEQEFLFHGLSTIPCVKEKGDWAMAFMNQDHRCFAERLVAWACIEGIFFSGSFCAIFWLKKRGVMPGLTFSNELISRDEGLHRDFAALLYKKLKHKLPVKYLTDIVVSSVECEQKFVTDAIPVKLIGMNAEWMGQYIEFVADNLLQTLGVPKHYNTPNPFEWMEMISLQGKTNFFERRVSEYQKSGVKEEDSESEDDPFGGEMDF